MSSHRTGDVVVRSQERLSDVWLVSRYLPYDVCNPGYAPREDFLGFGDSGRLFPGLCFQGTAMWDYGRY